MWYDPLELDSGALRRKAQVDVWALASRNDIVLVDGTSDGCTLRKRTHLPLLADFNTNTYKYTELLPTNVLNLQALLFEMTSVSTPDRMKI